VIAMSGMLRKVWPRKAVCVAIILLLIALIGITDYLAEPRVLVAAFYLFPIFLAAWYLGKYAGLSTCVLCTFFWVVGDAIDAGMPTPGVLIWNSAARFVVYAVVSLQWSSLRLAKAGLEEKVRIKTLSLQTEMEERKQLESELLQLDKNERERIGRDLHDMLGQQLVGIAFLAKDLEEQLTAEQRPEAAAAARVVSLINQATDQSRALARGLCPVELAEKGLMTALSELAAATEAVFKTRCVFQCERPVLIDDNVAAVHLYHIAQEAVTNAVKHGQARCVAIRLAGDDGRITLRIQDDGVGLPKTLSGEPQGMGIRLMHYRARSIDATLEITAGAQAGVVVLCTAPLRMKPEAARSSKVESEHVDSRQ
jgi:signal transduction histidine kinase